MTNSPEADSRPVGATGSSVVDDGEQAKKPVRFVPGQPDMWLFVLFETLVFTSYFVVYLYSRARNPELFLQSQARLSLPIGIVNTLVLLASSWSMAQCVQSARVGAFRSAVRHVVFTAVCAVVFLVSKVIEWGLLAHAGIGLSTNDFFTFYFFLTAIHLLHLLIGFIVLGVAYYQLTGPARRNQKIVETCATYWHTVDFLWVLIFSLLYVVR